MSEVKMTYSQLHGVIVNDNTNIDNMIRGFINESANASVVAIYDDSLVLVDTLKEDFYTAKYHYNPETLSVIIEGFDKIVLENDNDVDFKIAVKDYLVSEDSNSGELLNSYLKTLNKSRSEIESIVAEAVADKSYENVADFEELSFINEEFEDLRKEDFFEAYQERLITHPLNNVLFLDWENPVAFTLMETTEPKAFLNSKSKEKAKKLCASKEFKKKICSACKSFAEDVEEGGDQLLEMFADNLSLFSLNSTELKEAVSKAVMLDPELNGNYKQIAESVVHFINNDEGFGYLKEAIDISDGSESDAENKDSEEKPADSENKDSEENNDSEEKDEPAKELTAEEKKKLKDALKTVIEKATDEKIQSMAQDLLDKFGDDGEEDESPTDVSAVKESVRFLSI